MCLTLENIVATCGIGIEVDLRAFSQEIEQYNIEYEPEQHAAAIIRLEPATVLLYRTGSCVIVGAKDWGDLDSTVDLLQRLLSCIGVESQKFGEINVVNLAFSGTIERNLDLEICSIELGIENTEYEPEQSPFLVYRPPDFSCVLTVSSTGNVVLTGTTDEKEAQSAFTAFRSRSDFR